MKFLKYLNERAQEEPSFEDEFNYVSSTIRQMARAQRLNVSDIYVSDEQLLIMEILMQPTETFENVFKLLDFVAKIQKDILVDFKCDMDLWETKKGQPIFTFEFYQTTAGPTYDYYEDELPY